MYMYERRQQALSFSEYSSETGHGSWLQQQSYNQISILIVILDRACSFLYHDELQLQVFQGDFLRKGGEHLHLQVCHVPDAQVACAYAPCVP